MAPCPALALPLNLRRPCSPVAHQIKHDQVKTIERYNDDHRNKYLLAVGEARENLRHKTLKQIGPLMVRHTPFKRLPQFHCGFETQRERDTHPLQSLVLRYVPKITDVGVVPLMSAVPNLQR